MPRKQTSPATLNTEELRSKVLELRRQGLGYEAIAKQVGCSVSTANRAVAARLQELRDQAPEDTQAVRDIELQRLDESAAALHSKVLAGDPRATDVYLRVMERRARLLGLDAPVRSELTGAEGAPLIPDATDARAVLAKALADATRGVAGAPAGGSAGEPPG